MVVLRDFLARLPVLIEVHDVAVFESSQRYVVLVEGISHSRYERERYGYGVQLGESELVALVGVLLEECVELENGKVRGLTLLVSDNEMFASFGRQTAHADAAQHVRLNELLDLLAVLPRICHAHILECAFLRALQIDKFF